MKNIVFFNIGNRDLNFSEQVEISGEIINENLSYTKLKFRDLSEYVYNNYENYKQYINFPIIERILMRVRDQDKIDIQEIILFATDQELMHYTDTVFIAKILQKYLMDLRNVKEWKKCLSQLSKPKILLIKENPADLDLMNNYYNQAIKKISNQDINTAFISITSGTPAMNNMILFHSVKNLGKAADIIYLSNQSNFPAKIQFGKLLIKENVLNTLKDNIKVYDYYAALVHLKNHKSEFQNQNNYDLLSDLLTFSHSRMSFDFVKAEETINHLIDYSPENRSNTQKLQKQIYELSVLSERNVDRYMAELYWNMWVLYQRGQFIDFSGRLFRFSEEGLKQILNQILQVPLVQGKFLDLNWLKENPELLNYLQNYKVGSNTGIDYERPLTRLTITSIIEYYINKGHLDIEDTLGNIKAFDTLASMRNQSPIAHGFGGVSERKLYEAMIKNKRFECECEDFQKTLFNNLRSIFNGIFKDEELLTKNIYDEINDVILKIMDNKF